MAERLSHCRRVCCSGEPGYVRPLEMPPSVFTCKSLVGLKVKSDYITYSLPTTGCCFPNLKFLHYCSGYDSDRAASSENPFRSCPLLEELTIEGDYRKDVLNFNISAPELRTLTTIITEEVDEYDEDSDGEGSAEDRRGEPCNLFVDAPKLEKLSVAGQVMSKYFIENKNSLLQAKVELQEFGENCADRVAVFLGEISSVRKMSISVPDFKPCLSHAFSNLINLELVFNHQSCWKWLAEVFNRSRNLEYLVLDFAKIKLKKRQFSPPEFVSSCLSSQLKTLSIKEHRLRLVR